MPLGFLGHFHWGPGFLSVETYVSCVKERNDDVTAHKERRGRCRANRSSSLTELLYPLIYRSDMPTSPPPRIPSPTLATLQPITYCTATSFALGNGVVPGVFVSDRKGPG